MHATGFCKETWAPVVDELRAAGVANPVVAIDQPGHGDTPPPPGPPFDWWSLGEAVRTVATGSRFALGIGHSSGGAALVMAEVSSPGLFGSLLLVEPIVFPPPYARWEDNPLSASAARRRASFESAEHALENYRGKEPFAGWQERALRAYVEGCFRSEGRRWALKCRPDVEAEFYRAAGMHAVWERLPELSIPLVVVAGEHSDSHPEEFAAAQAERAGGSAVVVDSASHMVPMERPDAVARLAAELLGGGLPAGRR